MISSRTPSDWAIDMTGLVVQSLVVPWAEIAVLCAGLATIAPEWRGAVHLPAWAAFLLNFVVVDYAYYWNHRLLHGALWRAHVVHHTAERLDIWVTSRNTVWTPVLIVYLWLNATALFLLADPAPFAVAALITAALDVWRHSEMYPRERSAWFEAVGTLLLTPRDHAWHHSRSGFNRNFGANLGLWDRVHGTFYEAPEAPRDLGIPLGWSFMQKLLWTGPTA